MGNNRVDKIEEVLKETYEQLEYLIEQVGYYFEGGSNNDYGLKRMRKCTLADIPPGDIFECGAGLFFKTEYYNKPENEPHQQSMCFCVGSGEFAYFEGKNNTEVWQLVKLTVEDYEA